MHTLLEIEDAISRLPSAIQLQLIKDIPALCPDVFPADLWSEILADTTPRPEFSRVLDEVDSEFGQAPGRFPVLNGDSLRDKSDLARHAGFLARILRASSGNSKRRTRGRAFSLSD